MRWLLSHCLSVEEHAFSKKSMSRLLVANGYRLEEDLRLFVLFRLPKKTKIGLTTKNSDVFYGYCLVEIVNVLMRFFLVFFSEKIDKNGNKKQSDTQ